MLYLNLSPKKLTDLAEKLYKDHGLVISEKPTRIILIHPSTMLSGHDKINWFKPVYRISAIQNNTKKFIAYTNTKYLVLTGINQFRYLSQFQLVREKLKPQLIRMFVQLCEENNLIVP